MAERIKRSDLCFIVRHPVSAYVAHRRQVLVSLDLAQCPVGCFQETFPNLSLQAASKKIDRERGIYDAGVPFEAYGKTDRERMAKGELPRGVPLHPNV